MTPNILTLAAGAAFAIALVAMIAKNGGRQAVGRIGIGFGLINLVRLLTGRPAPVAALALFSGAGVGVGLLAMLAGGQG